MDFDFESFHFSMDSREKILAMKKLRLLPAALMAIVINELKNHNVISHVHLLGESEFEVIFRDAFHQSYEYPGIEHALETDLHYHGDFYRLNGHAVVAALKSN